MRKFLACFIAVCLCCLPLGLEAAPQKNASAKPAKAKPSKSAPSTKSAKPEKQAKATKEAKPTKSTKANQTAKAKAGSSPQSAQKASSKTKLAPSARAVQSPRAKARASQEKLQKQNRAKDKTRAVLALQGKLGRAAPALNYRSSAFKPSPNPALSFREMDGLESLRSSAALVIDQRAGTVLFQKNAGMVTPIASITKLMTAMVVLDAMPNLNAPLSISDADVDYLRGSRSRLPVGSTLTRETALLLALMSSENRAANALARHYPGGVSAFVMAMNRKAKALGMRQTRFDDPTGLSHENVSTARDLSLMVNAAYRYPLIREFSTRSDAELELSGQVLSFHNTNPLVKNASWAVGLSKTGFIREAGKCLVMQAYVANKPVIIVLLDSAGRQTRVADANRIRRWMEGASSTVKRGVEHALSSAGVSG